MRRKRSKISPPNKLSAFIRSFRFQLFIKIFVVLLILAGAILLFQAVQHELDKLQVITTSNSNQVRVEIVQRVDEDSSKIKNDISDFVRKTLKSRKKSTLSVLARQVQREFSADDVSIVTLDTTSLYLRVKPRRAVFSVGEIPNLRLSDRGDLYVDRRIYSTPSNVLFGIVSNKTNIRTDYTGTVVLDAMKQQAANKAIELLKSVQAQGFDYSNFRYIDYRGFALSGSDKNPEIIIGDVDFETRFKRLRQLIDKLPSTKIATKIELDFPDKAFIQEKPL